mmetsp:Transcript_45901/g.111190  ORF Transcript_45901/g.111190 Transcript_45901/m.111190 type:complete len:416 (+) Transcript_45901:142-1389(+)
MHADSPSIVVETRRGSQQLVLFALLLAGKLTIDSLQIRDFRFQKSSRQDAKHQEVKRHYDKLPEDWKTNLHMHILQSPDSLNRRKATTCGGCMVIWELYDSLIEMGISTTISKWSKCPKDKVLSDPIARNKTIVFVNPEYIDSTCVGSGNRVQVRWILAPLQSYYEYGDGKKAWNFRYWGEEDLVFNYCSSAAAHPELLPSSNILQVISNPKEGDRFDLYHQQSEVSNNTDHRQGTAFVVRKGSRWHKNMDRFHRRLPEPHRELKKFDDAVLRKFEYFVSYDPYTFYSFSAAMLGAISIVHPLDNTTKQDWAEGTYVGEYLKAKRLDNVPGIAYGPVKAEIDFAKETMPKLREFLMEVRHWGKTETVGRFARDCYRYGKGEREKLESGLLVRDAYTKWYGADNKMKSLANSPMSY